MRIPHDPVALEEHFKDDDEGPVSNQGYMPYLNKFILDKVPEQDTTYGFGLDDQRNVYGLKLVVA